MSGLTRPKNPQALREAILQAAKRLALQSGIQALTIQSVADAAEVTKGGLMHHFPGKEPLLSALRARAFQEFGARINAHLQEEPALAQGRFTRAYISAILEADAPDLITALWGDPDLRRDWYTWLASQEANHARTDSHDALKLLRFAADGLWLAALDGAAGQDWADRLTAASRLTR